MNIFLILDQTARAFMTARTNRPRRGPLGLLISITICLFSSNAHGGQPLKPEDLLKRLNDVLIDTSQIYFLRDAQLTRDRVKIYLNRGFMGFLTPVAGEVTGAAFVGDGEVLMNPPSSSEKASLVHFIQAPILEERFTSAYLRFTDQTARELLAKASRPGPEQTEQSGRLVQHWRATVRELSPAYSMRILQDLLGSRDFPYFTARVESVHLGTFDVTDDERQQEALSVSAAAPGHRTLPTDIWCAFPSQVSKARSSSLAADPFRVGSYKIDARINPDNSLEAQAELEVESRSSLDRVFGFELSRQLKVLEVKDEQRQNLVWIPNPGIEESKVAARGDAGIFIVLGAPHPTGQKFRLGFSYQGNVITEGANGVLYVGAEGSWYPSRSFSSPASYDLSFHYPERLTLVATGRRLEETLKGDLKHSRWVSGGVVPGAGFNLGANESTSRHVGNALIEVYGDRGGGAPLGNHSAEGPQTAALLDRVAESAVRLVRYFESLFGPFPYSRLAISQIPGNFHPEWPELLYLSSLSVPPGAERLAPSLCEESNTRGQQTLLARDIARQWWGNAIVWKSYHDQWLGEAFATYAAALALAHETNGDLEFRELLRGYKQDLLTKTPGGSTVESAGPIWLGYRLSNSLNPDGYNAIVQRKACWVLHMLRSLMTDPVTESDEIFFRMLRNFVAAYRSRAASTEDFIRHAEKYMTPAADLDRTRRLDWFFNEWVRATGIPTYQLKVTTQQLGPKEFDIQGTIQQDGVPQEFEMLVPVVAWMEKERKIELGRVVVTDSGGSFHFQTTAAPSRVMIDEDKVLAVTR